MTKKTELVPILLLRGARSFFDAKKMKKKIASLDFRDNPIFPISNSDGQDREVYFFVQTLTEDNTQVNK